MLKKDYVHEIVQERMSKSENSLTIRVLRLAYSLRVTENKRFLVWRNFGGGRMCVRTRPYHISARRLLKPS